MSEHILLLSLFIFLVAGLYASVGHGGASGYLALMTLMSMPIATIKPVALMLNIAVSLIAFIQFYRSGFFNKKLFIPLAIASVPAAYAGGLLSIDPHLYKQLLGGLLFISAVRLAMPLKKEVIVVQHFNIVLVVMIGASIGFLSGMIGIGGGIILSPLLILVRYSDVKTTSGISALFIFVNSIAGLLGQMKQGIEFSSSMSVMIAVAIAGGLIGSYIGARQLNISMLKKVLAVVLFIASLKLIFV
ncbi:MAG: sulfite exporter TauE/SafE family protein [Chitinophagaceae bacterium]|nr:sulfite exporter TauE/SafE family protein [Chitinophagaceae bacterium]